MAVIYSFPRYPAGTQALGKSGSGTSSSASRIAACPPLLLLPTSPLEALMKFITFIDPAAGVPAATHALLTAF